MTSVVQVLHHDELLATGLSQRRIRALLASGAVVQLRPGFFARGAEWKTAKPEARVVARARALARASAHRPVFSHETAAALHGLPLFRADPDRVHTIARIERPGSAVGVIRHRGDLTADIIEVDGVLCTSLTRTVADTARTMTFEQAVTIADAALRLQSVPRAGAYDVDRAAAFREGARAIASRSAHGITKARRVLDFADGRAELPGETISRVRLHGAGFRRIGLQVHVEGPNGRDFFVDFELEETPAFGEFDGSIKYVDGKMLDGRSTAEVFDREKQREDWIRGRTQHRFARWGWPHITSSATLAKRLASFGITPTSVTDHLSWC